MRLEKYTQNKNGIHCYNLENFASSFSEWENMVGVDCNSLGNFTTIFYEWNNIQHVNVPIMGQFVILRWKNGQIKRKYVRSIIDTERSIIDTFATTVKCPQIYRNLQENQNLSVKFQTTSDKSCNICLYSVVYPESSSESHREDL